MLFASAIRKICPFTFYSKKSRKGDVILTNIGVLYSPKINVIQIKPALNNYSFPKELACIIIGTLKFYYNCIGKKKMNKKRDSRCSWQVNLGKNGLFIEGKMTSVKYNFIYW